MPAQEFDVCVIGTGVGGGVMIDQLTAAGFSVVALERGPELSLADFDDDELRNVIRDQVFSRDQLETFRSDPKARATGGTLQLSLFDQQDLAEIRDPAYPGERLVVCKNPLLATERGRKRGELLAATERQLAAITVAVTRAKRPLRGQAPIALRVGKVLGRFRMAKHFTLTITDDSFRYQRDEAALAAEAALDGIYVVRTSVGAARLTTEEVVRSYKRLANVERAFRSLKTVDLHIPPDPPSQAGARPSPRPAVHAELLRRVAHASRACPAPLR